MRDIVVTKGTGVTVAELERLEVYARVGDAMREVLSHTSAHLNELCSLKATYSTARKKRYRFKSPSADKIYRALYTLEWNNTALAFSKRHGLHLWSNLDVALYNDVDRSRCEAVSRPSCGTNASDMASLLSMNVIREDGRNPPPPEAEHLTSSTVVTLRDLETLSRLCAKHDAWAALAVATVADSKCDKSRKSTTAGIAKRHIKLVDKLRRVIGLQAAAYAMSKLSSVLPRGCVDQITQIVLKG